MTEQLSEHASALRLVEADGGWEPEEGTEVSIWVTGGRGREGFMVGPVSRIITTSDAWIAWWAERDEVTWVRRDWIICVTSVGGADAGQERRTGFA